MLRYRLPIPCIPSVTPCVHSTVCVAMSSSVLLLPWTPQKRENHNATVRHISQRVLLGRQLPLQWTWLKTSGWIDRWFVSELRGTKTATRKNLSFTSLLYNDLFVYLFTQVFKSMYIYVSYFSTNMCYWSRAIDHWTYTRTQSLVWVFPSKKIIQHLLLSSYSILILTSFRGSCC